MTPLAASNRSLLTDNFMICSIVFTNISIVLPIARIEAALPNDPRPNKPPVNPDQKEALPNELRS